MSGEININEVPLSNAFLRSRVEAFLAQSGLRLETSGTYVTLTDADERILAGGALEDDVIKCVAVSEEARSLGLSAKLISYLVAAASRRGYNSVKVFTKPHNEAVFSSMGFHKIASAPDAILMENGSGLERYREYLASEAASAPLPGEGPVGVIILNANPFTLGHRYLIEEACKCVDRLFVIPVAEDRSMFGYRQRLRMIEEGCRDMRGVTVLEGSAYAVSAATFPTYFLKDLSKASVTQMTLDIDLYCNHLATALGGGTGGREVVRFVGSEPEDRLTAQYNALMSRLLPQYGLSLREIPRLRDDSGNVYSASRVRKALSDGDYALAAALTPPEVHPYLAAKLCRRALEIELDLEPKPGLVSPQSEGAHDDMDYDMMRRSIDALEPWFVRMAQIDWSVAGDGPVKELCRLGIEAEDAMLKATGGVNTHRGAIFCLGLAATAYSCRSQGHGGEDLQEIIAAIAQRLPGDSRSHGSEAARRYSVRGAMQMARDGYRDEFDKWLPYYRSVKEGDQALLRTLLLIMSGLEDTCVIHRGGILRSDELRQECAMIWGNFSLDAVEDLDRRLCYEGISPGGSADMLALTVLLDSLLPKDSRHKMTITQNNSN